MAIEGDLKCVIFMSCLSACHIFIFLLQDSQLSLQWRIQDFPDGVPTPKFDANAYYLA